MKTDDKGCSTCSRGEERHETFTTAIGVFRVQYDYRLPGGTLFACTEENLAACREKRDEWLADMAE